MTYFSDFDYSMDYYDNPVVRERILHEVEQNLFEEDSSESVPWDLLEDF